jgi:hypothetical protein
VAQELYPKAPKYQLELLIKKTLPINKDTDQVSTIAVSMTVSSQIWSLSLSLSLSLQNDPREGRRRKLKKTTLPL